MHKSTTEEEMARIQRELDKRGAIKLRIITSLKELSHGGMWGELPDFPQPGEPLRLEWVADFLEALPKSQKDVIEENERLAANLKGFRELRSATRLFLGLETR